MSKKQFSIKVNYEKYNYIRFFASVSRTEMLASKESPSHSFYNLRSSISIRLPSEIHQVLPSSLYLKRSREYNFRCFLVNAFSWQNDHTKHPEIDYFPGRKKRLIPKNLDMNDSKLFAYGVCKKLRKIISSICQGLFEH